jgi:hypothetical protein
MCFDIVFTMQRINRIAHPHGECALFHTPCTDLRFGLRELDVHRRWRYRFLLRARFVLVFVFVGTYSALPSLQPYLFPNLHILHTVLPTVPAARAPRLGNLNW